MTTGRILLALGLLFMLMDAVTHILGIQPVVDAFTKLAIPLSLMMPLGALVAVILALFVLRKTRLLGAVLLTGYLGGAVAIHVRNQSTLFEQIFPIIIGTVIWIGLYMTDKRVKAAF